MFIFGKKRIFNATEKELDALIHTARLRNAKKRKSIEEIINALSRIAELWLVNGKYYNKALELMNKTSGFSPAMNKESLNIIPELFKASNLRKRLETEFSKTSYLDDFDFHERLEANIKYEPQGLLLHVTAGNIFLGAIDSLLMGILTKNISILKLSKDHQAIAALFIESLVEADKKSVFIEDISIIYWKGGDLRVESYLKKHMDAIVLWGGEEMVQSYLKELSPRTKLIKHGPKISFHVLTKNYLSEMADEDYQKIAFDVAMWDQSACANSQNIFLEQGSDISAFSKKLATALSQFDYEIGAFSGPDRLERFEKEALGIYAEFKYGIKPEVAKDYLITFSDNMNLETSSGKRHILLKNYDEIEDLAQSCKNFRFYLQTCGLGTSAKDEKNIQGHIASTGITRICLPGDMLKAQIGLPHDGSFNLTDFTKIVTSEIENDISHFALRLIKKMSYYDQFKIERFEDIPLIGGDTLAKYPIDQTNAFLTTTMDHGYTFSSGGTSGAPKYAFYTKEEFHEIASVLGESYMNNGLKDGDRVANLFVAGNMWSSFSAIQYALEKLPVVQFPMGGMIDPGEFLRLVLAFKINTLFGLPSMICELAKSSPHLKIEKIFYAGEPFSLAARKIIEDCWGNVAIASAGYASVDAGPIGYQDNSCSLNEHILFSKLVHLEIVDSEAVVTSLIRKTMPIIRYRTGDKVEIIENSSGRIKFNLTGRVDGLVNIWSTRFSLKDLSRTLKTYGVKDWQVVLRSEILADVLEVVTVDEVISENQSLIVEALYKNCKDINQTHPLDFIKSKIKFRKASMEVSEKTGKFKLLLDKRK